MIVVQFLSELCRFLWADFGPKPAGTYFSFISESDDGRAVFGGALSEFFCQASLLPPDSQSLIHRLRVAAEEGSRSVERFTSSFLQERRDLSTGRGGVAGRVLPLQLTEALRSFPAETPTQPGGNGGPGGESGSLMKGAVRHKPIRTSP